MSNSRLNARRAWAARAALLVAALAVGFARAGAREPVRRSLSAAAYPTLQHALDKNSGCLIYLPAGDYAIDTPIRITSENSGLWGPGRIIQCNADAEIISASGAPGVQLRALTLTRAAGRQETHKSALVVTNRPHAVIANVQVLDNWADASAISIDRTYGAIRTRRDHAIGYATKV